MVSLKTFLQEDEEIQLKINKTFRSWIMIILGQSMLFFLLLYLMRNQREILRALVSVGYIAICSWMLAIKIYNKRLVTNKKIILLSRNSPNPVKFIYLSRIARMTISNSLLSGQTINIFMNNKNIYRIHDVSYNRDYISYIDALILGNKIVANASKSEEILEKSKNAQGFVSDKLTNSEDIHITNIINKHAEISDKLNEDDVAKSIKEILANHPANHQTQPQPQPQSKTAQDNMQNVA